MNSSQALTTLRKLLGSSAAIRDSNKPSSPEQRDVAQAARKMANERKRECDESLKARREIVLKADEEYQRLLAEYQAARVAQEQAPWPRYRYTAGTSGSLFFTVAAEADTLAELVDKVESSRAAKKVA